MGTTITLTTPSISVTITGDGVYSGCTYNRLDGWYGVDDVELGLVRRPSAPGSFAPQRTYPGSRVISIEGDFFGITRADALAMREDLTMLYNDGQPITMTVTDDLRTTSREILVASISLPWTIHPEFQFTIDATAPDPRRYGEAGALTTGLAQAGTGMSWPITWPLDWGTIGVTGRVTLANDGSTETLPWFTVSGGSMPDGFEIVNTGTGERIVYVGPVGTGNTVAINSRTRSALINGNGPGSRYLAAPQWFGIPARSSVEVQFLARGPVTGTPTLQAFAAPAYY